MALGQKCFGHGKADNACPDDGDFSADVLGHLDPAKARRTLVRRCS
jgi:hypothetical protein